MLRPLWSVLADDISGFPALPGPAATVPFSSFKTGIGNVSGGAAGGTAFNGGGDSIGSEISSSAPGVACQEAPASPFLLLQHSSPSHQQPFSPSNSVDLVQSLPLPDSLHSTDATASSSKVESQQTVGASYRIVEDLQSMQF
ncbi:unnamed protein product, partial [Protopolystoma xenopodis]